MKGTPEMVVNVCAQTGLGPSTVQRVLDIALADLPEPSMDATEYRRLWGLCTDSRLRACERAEAAEAKLAKVRACTQSDLDEGEITDPAVILAILDER